MVQWKRYVRLLLRVARPLWSRNPFTITRAYIKFLSDFRLYCKLDGAQKVTIVNLYPCLFDSTHVTSLDTHYFLQDTWAARKIFEAKPIHHVDIGSTALLVGILSQFTTVYSLDIRPLSVVKLSGLHVVAGSIVNLPFADGSVSSLSSLCVIEHIGLGRYGDALDPQGSEKAIRELTRVLAPGGNLYVSVPIAQTDTVFFNAHRAFEVEGFIAKFTGLQLVEDAFIQESTIYTHDALDTIDISRLTVGLFHFRRPV